MIHEPHKRRACGSICVSAARGALTFALIVSISTDCFAQKSQPVDLTQAKEGVAFNVGGQNLLKPYHFAFIDGLQVQPTLAERSVVGKVAWRF
jgi:hypothetical protein